MADDIAAIVDAAAGAQPSAAPAGESSSPSSEVSAASSATADTSTSTTTSPSSSSDAATESTPSLISTADADRAKPAATEIGDKAKPADTAKPETAVTEAAKDKASEAKPDAKADADKPADQAAPAEQAPAQEQQARSYEAFKVPEGMTLAQKEVKEFTDILDDQKISHQERGQKLVDFYVREAQRLATESRNQQRKAWSDFTQGLKDDFKADPELGGNRQDTVLGTAKAVIERFGGSDAQKSDLYAMLDHTGMGNHKGLVRVLNNIYETFLREPSPVTGQPPAMRNGGSRQQAFYGDS
jgi:hypothetical protein